MCPRDSEYCFKRRSCKLKEETVSNTCQIHGSGLSHFELSCLRRTRTKWNWCWHLQIYFTVIRSYDVKLWPTQLFPHSAKPAVTMYCYFPDVMLHYASVYKGVRIGYILHKGRTSTCSWTRSLKVKKRSAAWNISTFASSRVVKWLNVLQYFLLSGAFHYVNERGVLCQDLLDWSVLLQLWTGEIWNILHAEREKINSKNKCCSKNWTT